MEDDDPGVEGGGGEPVSAGVGMKREGLWKSVTDLLLTGKGMTHVMKGVGGGGEDNIQHTQDCDHLTQHRRRPCELYAVV